jgi:hypothetical protein
MTYELAVSRRGHATQTIDVIVNDALRCGLNDLTARPKRRNPFRTQSVELGRLRLVGIDNITKAFRSQKAKGLNDLG